MRIYASIKGNKEQAREYVKRAMYATMGKSIVTKGLSDSTFEKLLISGDSPCKEYEFWIACYDVPERVHTHVIRHERIGKYVATQRPDLQTGNFEKGKRDFILKIDALRLIEIMKLRLCNASWIETRLFFSQVALAVIGCDQIFNNLLAQSCVWLGFCNNKKKCGFCGTDQHEYLRQKLIEKVS